MSKPTVERWERSDKPITGPIVPLLYLLTPEKIEAVVLPERQLPIRMLYMYKERVCTLIEADERTRRVKIKNYTDHNQFRAFGCNETPSFEDYEEFLRSHCFPETRDKLKLILQDLDLPF